MIGDLVSQDSFPSWPLFWVAVGVILLVVLPLVGYLLISSMRGYEGWHAKGTNDGYTPRARQRDAGRNLPDHQAGDLPDREAASPGVLALPDLAAAAAPAQALGLQPAAAPDLPHGQTPRHRIGVRAVPAPARHRRVAAGQWVQLDPPEPEYPLAGFMSSLSDRDVWAAMHFELRRLVDVAADPYDFPERLRW